MTFPYPYAKTKKKIRFDQVVSKSYWNWRTNPAIMVPTMISSSIAVLSQSIYVIFATALLVELEASGVIARINADLSTGNTSALVSALLSPGILSEIIAFLAIAFVVSTIVSILASGVAYSAEFVSYLKVLNGERLGIRAVASTLKEKWRKMAWTLFLVQLFTYLPIALIMTLGLTAIYYSGPSQISLIVLLLLFSVGLVPTLILMFIFTFSLIAVAADNLSGIAALKKSYSIVRGNFGTSATYALVRILSYLLITAAAGIASTLGFPLTSIASIAVTLILVPVLHMAKTTIYLEVPKEGDMPFEIYGPMSSTRDLLGGPFFRFAFRKLKHGVVELKNFALSFRNLPYHAASAIALLIGVWIGLYIGKNGLDAAILGLGYTPGRINPTILNAVPLTEGFDIFLHNWQVSLSTSLSGLWLVAPSLVTLAFNGMVLGAVYYLTPNFTMFAAAIFPHGSIEIPSFVLAGSAGTRLGLAFIRTFGKEKTSPESVRFEAIASQTIYVLVGLAVLFFVAGLIEGNITPVIMRMYGWQG
jgi:Stage II sporulation protein M